MKLVLVCLYVAVDLMLCPFIYIILTNIYMKIYFFVVNEAGKDVLFV